MKKELKSILEKLELIESDKLNQLQGGFVSFATDSNLQEGTQIVNNCKAGACTNSNCATNCTGPGCGSKDASYKLVLQI
jgi:hypothetical protein